MIRRPPIDTYTITLCPYTARFRSEAGEEGERSGHGTARLRVQCAVPVPPVGVRRRAPPGDLPLGPRGPLDDVALVVQVEAQTERVDGEPACELVAGLCVLLHHALELGEADLGGLPGPRQVLSELVDRAAVGEEDLHHRLELERGGCGGLAEPGAQRPPAGSGDGVQDRKRVGSGKSVAVRVD